LYNDITGVILAGGKSKRMGENKALLKIDGIPVIEKTADLLQKLFNEVIIITNTPDEYSFLGLKMFGDIYLNAGPLGGIHSALTNSHTEKNFILSCDIPFMTADVIREIIGYKTELPVTVVKADGYIQQLAGLYKRSILPEIEAILGCSYESRKCKVLTLLENVGAEIIEAEAISSCRNETFLNMNSRADFQKVQTILGQAQILY
jgi:molybdopterin-guanine dinucleotide biosynthesis protein A